MPIKPIAKKRKFQNVTRAENAQLKIMLDTYQNNLNKKENEIPIKKAEPPAHDMWSFGPHMIPDFSHATDAFEHVVDGFKKKTVT